MGRNLKTLWMAVMMASRSSLNDEIPGMAYLVPVGSPLYLWPPAIAPRFYPVTHRPYAIV